MDTIFFATSFVFIVFLIVSYFLNVIRLSVPLLIIYFIYCFDYIVNTDQDLNNNQPITNYDYKDSDQLLSLQTGKIPSKDIKNINENQINPIPKPIVSYTPKPIKIDSNIIIQKGLDKKNDKNILKNTEVVEENLIKKESTLELNEIMICRGIYKRNPIKPGYEFINSVK